MRSGCRPGHAVTAFLLFLLVQASSSTLLPAPKLLVVSLDGFRPDYVTADQTPHLHDIATHGVNGVGMRSVFGTKTYPNHMSIATGLFEEEHGIVHNAMYDPVFNATFEETNSEERWWDNGRSNPIWTANQAENDDLIRNSGVIMWPGSHVKYRNGKVIPKYVKPYESQPNLTEVAETIVSWFSADVNCIFTYINQPDETSHLYGPHSEEVKEMVHKLDLFIGYLMKRLQETSLLPQVNLLVLSDHGMAEVTSDRVIEMNTFMDRSSYELYGCSPLWTIRPKARQMDYVYNALQQESEKRKTFKVYKKKDMPSEWRYQKNRRILDLVLIADDGYDIVDERKNLKQVPGRVWGNHGYNNSLPSMRPLFLAQGPAFRTPVRIEEDFLNIDLYPLMCMLLHLFPLERFPSSGSLRVLHQVLRPIVRDAPSGNLLSVLSAILIAATVICCGAACFVFCSSIGRRRKRLEADWDPGVTEFDFGQKEWDLPAISFTRRKAKVTPPSSESVLLLDSDDSPIL